MNTAAIDLATDAMAHELLARGEPIHFVARGQSMWPHIQDGETVCIEPISSPINVGDVVLIPHPGFGRLHRVIEVSSEDRVRIRGDALISADGWFETNELAGRLRGIIRNGEEKTPADGRKTVLVSTVLGYARRIVSLLK
jgi:hypothetical protein